MRDRLIELLRQAEFAYLDFSKLHPYEKSLTDFTADYLLENGVIVPPCKVGDVVYDISEFFDGTNYPEIYEYDVLCIHIEEEKGKQIFYIADLKYPDNAWGKTLFFDKQKAEQALKGGGEE